MGARSKPKADRQGGGTGPQHRRRQLEGPESRKSIWDQEALPTLLTMPILCSIVAFILAFASFGIFHWFTFSLKAESLDTDFVGKTKLNYFLDFQRVREWDNGEPTKDYGKTYTEGNSSSDLIWGEDKHQVIPFMNNLRMLVQATFLLSMATAVLTIFSRRGMLPLNTKNITTAAALLMVMLALGTAIFFAVKAPNTIQQHLEDETKERNIIEKNGTLPSPLFGRETGINRAIEDRANQYLVRGEMSYSYYPGPAWFIMLVALPALGYATYHFQGLENAGEEQSLAKFIGERRGKGADKPKGKPSPAAKGPSLSDLGMGGVAAEGRTASRRGRRREKPSRGAKGPSLADLGVEGGGGAPRERSSRRGRGRAAKASGGRSRAPMSRAGGPAAGAGGGAEAEFRRLVAEYKQFTGKQRLSTNELARLKAMARKK